MAPQVAFLAAPGAMSAATLQPPPAFADAFGPPPWPEPLHDPPPVGERAIRAPERWA